MRQRRKAFERRIARERIDVLFALAEEEAIRGRLPRADRYGQLARRIGMRYNVSLPPHYRRLVCRGCGAYLAPGLAATLRLHRSRVIVTCRSCGRIFRFPYTREVRERRTSSRR